MIDKSYYDADMAIYYADFLASFAAFLACFIWAVETDGWMRVLPMILGSLSLYRGACFAHEITHRQGDRKMRRFALLWNLTVGAVILLPASRFYKPHLTHHSLGVFGTKDDPQYLPLRTNHALMIFVVFIAPFLMPFLNLFLATTASLGANAEEGLERVLRRHGFTMGSDVEERYRKEITWLSRYYLAVFAVFCLMAPQWLPVYYAILVGGWMAGTTRIPFEHRMIGHVAQTDKRDHVLDSFTVEAPLAALLQPLGLRFHTAHHIYPGVPYHNLRRLHEELKGRGDKDYNANVISFWRAVRGPQPLSVDETATS